MIPKDTITIKKIKTTLAKKGFKFDDAPHTEELIEALVKEIIAAVKMATVNTIVTGSLTPPTAVAGTGIGDPATGTGLK